MARIDENPEWLAAYRDAMAKDAAFGEAVVKQFGKKNAGTMRYVASAHNAEVSELAEIKWRADNRLREISERMRKALAA